MEFYFCYIQLGHVVYLNLRIIDILLLEGQYRLHGMADSELKLESLFEIDISFVDSCFVGLGCWFQG